MSLSLSFICLSNWLKIFFRIGFHACVWVFAVKTVKDTQCGFKVKPSVTYKLSFIYLPASEKENCGSSFQYPSHREMGFWRGDVEGTAIRKGCYTSAISSVQNMYDLTFYIWWECYYFQVAEMLQIPLGEVSVRWQEIDGSKLSPLLAAIEMFRLLHLTSHVTNWWYLLFQGYFLAVAEICYWRLENSREESLIVAAFETPMRKALGSTIFSVCKKNCFGPIHSSWELAHFFWTIPLK